MSDDPQGTLSPTLTPPRRAEGTETSTEALPTTSAERYVVHRELGQGGQSVVFAARDASLGRDVALKTARQKGEAASSFVREARITGQLEHPGIVPVHELGRTGTGDIYCTQKLVRGRTLREALEAAQTLEARLALLPHFIDLCHAVAYAHSRGVVHRDLKPENVMVGEFGETVVLDWGVARVLGAPEELPAEATPLERAEPLQTARRLDGVVSGSTQRGSVVGTPLYMSPEQARGENDAVDARSDVWSLGVMLYELLAFLRPFDATDVRALLLDVRRGHFRPLRDVAPDAPPELVAIVEQAMQVDAARRPADARALASQLSDFRAGKRVAAYQYTSWELVKRFVARNRALTAVSLIGLVVLGASEIYAWSLVDARDRGLADERAKVHASLATQALDAERARDWTRAAALHLAEGSAHHRLAATVLSRWVTTPTREAARLPRSASGPGSFDVESGRGLLVTSDGVFSVEGAQAWRLLEGSTDPERRAQPSVIAPGGARWALKAGSLRLISADGASDVVSGAEKATRVAFSPDGARLAVAVPGAVRLHDAHGALLSELSGAPDAPSALALSSDGSVAVAGEDGTVRWWRRPDAAPVTFTVQLGRRLVSLAFSLDGLLLFGGDEDGRVQVLVAEQGRLLHELTGHRLPVEHVRQAPDGRTLATASADGAVLLWDLATWQLLARLQAEGDEVSALSYSAEGATLGALLRTGERVRWPLGALREARPVASLDDGPALGLQAAKGGGAWLRSAKGLSLLSPGGDVLWTREGVRGGEGLVTELGLMLGKPGQLDLHSTTDGEVLESTKPCRATVWSVVSNGGDVWLACGTELRTLTEGTGVHARAPMRHLALSSAGDRLAWSAEDGTGGLVAVPELRTEESWSGRQGLALAFDAAGKHLLSAGEDGVVLRHGQSGVELRKLTTEDLHVVAVGFALDGAVAWAAGVEGVHLWTVDDGQWLLQLPGLHGALVAAAPTDDAAGCGSPTPPAVSSAAHGGQAEAL